MSAEIGHWFGVGGVASHDNARAHRWQARLHWVMAGVALLSVPAFYLEDISLDPRLHIAGWVIDFFIFAAFTAELLWMLRVTSHKTQYLGRNWLNVLIVLAAAANLSGMGGEWIPLARLLRLALPLLLLLRVLGSLRKLFSPGGVPYILGFAVVSLALAGSGFYWLEPTVHSFGEGLWLAFVTGSTVGYGDFVPTTTAARFFAVLMVMVGFTLLSLVTASIAAFFIGEDEKILRREMHRDIKELRDEVALLREELKQHREVLARPVGERKGGA